MPRGWVTVPFNEFALGEVSPRVYGQFGTNIYKQGVATMYNFLPTAGGGFRRRPGTRHITNLSGTGSYRIFDFQAVDGTPYFLLVYAGGIDVYSLSTHTKVSGTSLTNTYTDADIPYVTYAQTNGLFLLFCDGNANYAPLLVTNSADDGTGTWSASAPTFNGEIVYTNFSTTSGSNVITYSIPSNYPFRGFGGVATGEAITGSGIPASTTVSSISGNTITMSNNATATATDVIITFSGIANFMTTGYYPGCGEFSDGRLWVSDVPGQRSAQFASKVPSVYVGDISDYTNFNLGEGYVTDAIYSLQSGMTLPTHWIFGKDRSLLVGNARNVWFDISNPPPAPGTFGLKSTSEYGANRSRPREFVDVMLYASNDQRTFRSMILNLYRGRYYDENLSMYSDHLMSRHIADFCLSEHPEPVAWMMMEDGTLITATVQRSDQGFTIKAGAGFAQHQLGGSGLVKAICSAPNSNYDEVWMVVSRTLSGTTTYTLEYLYLDNVHTTAINDAVYLDNSISVTNGSASETTSGYTDLNGWQIAVLADGAIGSPGSSAVSPSGTYQTVSGGSINLTVAATQVLVGLPYYSEIKTLPPDTPARGVGQSKEKRIEKAWVRMYKSYGGWIGTTAPTSPPTDFTPLEPMRYELYNSATYGSAPSLFDGDVVLPLSQNVDALSEVYFETGDPFPMNATAILARIAVMET